VKEGDERVMKSESKRVKGDDRVKHGDDRVIISGIKVEKIAKKW